MDLQGYALIPANANIISTHPDTFKGRIVRVLEFSKNVKGEVDGCLCINGEATAIADVRTKPLHWFECSTHMGFICPSGLSELDKFVYVNRLINKGFTQEKWRILITVSSMVYNKYTDTNLIT